MVVKECKRCGRFILNEQRLSYEENKIFKKVIQTETLIVALDLSAVLVLCDECKNNTTK